MKAIILAAGYGTRLYPLTINLPKALLDVGGKSILLRILEKMSGIDGCNEYFLVSNEKFYKSFCSYLIRDEVKKVMKKRKIKVLNDKTASNETRLGAIGDINFAVESCNIDDDVIVLGSDNLFDFNLAKFIDFAKSKAPSASLALYDIKNIKLAGLYGISMLDKNTNELLDFQEKPNDPKGTLAATAIYYYPKDKLTLLKEYMAAGNSKDAPGNFIKWLKEREKVYGFVFEEKWYDIGDKESLGKADKEYRKKERS